MRLQTLQRFSKENENTEASQGLGNERTQECQRTSNYCSQRLNKKYFVKFNLSLTTLTEALRSFCLGK